MKQLVNITFITLFVLTSTACSPEQPKTPPHLISLENFDTQKLIDENRQYIDKQITEIDGKTIIYGNIDDKNNLFVTTKEKATGFAIILGKTIDEKCIAEYFYINGQKLYERGFVSKEGCHGNPFNDEIYSNSMLHLVKYYNNGKIKQIVTPFQNIANNEFIPEKIYNKSEDEKIKSLNDYSNILEPKFFSQRTIFYTDTKDILIYQYQYFNERYNVGKIIFSTTDKDNNRIITEGDIFYHRNKNEKLNFLLKKHIDWRTNNINKFVWKNNIATNSKYTSLSNIDEEVYKDYKHFIELVDKKMKKLSNINDDKK